MLQRNGIAGDWSCSGRVVPPGQTRPQTCCDADPSWGWAHPGYVSSSQQTVSVERLDDDVTFDPVASTGPASLWTAHIESFNRARETNA